MVGPTSPSVFSKAWISLDALCPFGNISVKSRDHPWAGKGHSSLCSSTTCPEEPKSGRWPGDTVLPRATAVPGSQVSPTVHDTLLRALGIYYNECALVTQYLCDDLFLCLSHNFFFFFLRLKAADEAKHCFLLFVFGIALASLGISKWAKSFSREKQI